VQSGEWVGKMTFPETEAYLRTDIVFDEMSDEEHHLCASSLSATLLQVSAWLANLYWVICTILAAIHRICYLRLMRSKWLISTSRLLLIQTMFLRSMEVAIFRQMTMVIQVV
jgi:hypothetical protein